MVEPPAHQATRPMTTTTTAIRGRWISVYRQPLRWLPLTVWRAVHLARGTVIRGVAANPMRAALATSDATRRADEHHRTDQALTTAAARIAQLLHDEDQRRREAP